MELLLLDSNLVRIGPLDTCDSIIWVDRYNTVGDFESFAPPDVTNLTILAQSYYAQYEKSEHVMIIEDINIHTDPVNGNSLRVKGRSLESILDRRIVWGTSVLSGNLQNAIQQLLLDHVIDPLDTTRIISRLEFSPSTDPAITSLTIDNQFTGDFILDVISDICVRYGIGFKITLTSLGKFQFKLYAGADRSYAQITNPWITFSPGFDNLINADYHLTSQFLKTVALVAGEVGVGNARKSIEVPAITGANSDLARREMFVDAQGITSSTPDGDLTDYEYLLLLEEKGLEELAKNTVIQSFDGQADTEDGMYVYGQDFFMGDILQIANDYGHEGQSRITEIIYSQDSNGTKIYPTFSAR
jgi:hypothetical protein